MSTRPRRTSPRSAGQAPSRGAGELPDTAAMVVSQLADVSAELADRADLSQSTVDRVASHLAAASRYVDMSADAMRRGVRRAHRVGYDDPRARRDLSTSAAFSRLAYDQIDAAWSTLSRAA